MRYIIDHIPKNTPKNRRPGLPMQAEYLTIHNTGNAKSTARNERGWLTNPSNDRDASYHIVVDEREAIECIPLNENAWHAGDGHGNGNRKSIGIEICESGDYSKALDNAATLVAKMLIERNWGIDRLRRHWDWGNDKYRKICPRLMYDGGKWTGWTAFKNLVQYKLNLLKLNKEEEKLVNELKAKVEKLESRIKEFESHQKMDVPEWAKEAVDAAVKSGIIDTPNGGSYDFYRLLTIMYRRDGK